MTRRGIQRIEVIDSHTGGEPTRIVVAGGPDLGGGSMRERLAVLRERYDWLRTALVCEPRGSDVMVGGLLQEPVDAHCAAGAIYFNNVGYLGMCGHGTIGLVATLAYLERIKVGTHRLETPVGTVTTTLHEDGRVSVENVPAYRYRKDVAVEVSGIGTFVGDVAWGGNWFFLVGDHGQELALARASALSDYAWRVREALHKHGITGKDGAEIDHIELTGPASAPDVADVRNFVLCPGKAYDRSPCGTGTSAKLACLAADGKLEPGQTWRQESILGSVFEGRFRRDGDKIVPTIKGTAHVNAEVTLVIDPQDPFAHGIGAREL
jgi:4-hydroxyproline epimerase